MKRSLLSLALAVAAAFGAHAQTLPAVPNGGFEQWQVQGSVNGPVGWTTSDMVYGSAAPWPFPIATSVQTNDRHSGQSALKLQAADLGVALLPPFLILGNTPDFQGDYPGGMACNVRPAALQFWYKYQGSVNDTTRAAVILTTGRGASKAEVGGGALALTPNASTASYRLGQVLIGYDPTVAVVPDSLYAVFVGNGATAAGTLFLDDITLTNTVTSAPEPVLAGALVAYPNPSADGLFKVRAEQDHDIVAGTLTVTDATGRTVLRQPPVKAGEVATGRRIDLRGHQPGLYVLRLEAPRGTVVRRLLLN